MVERTAEERLYLSTITLGELLKGFVMLDQGRRRDELEGWYRNDFAPRFRARTLAVTTGVAERWGVLDGAMKKRGITLSVTDGLIAATALEHGLTVVTGNVRDFEDAGVDLVNPWVVQDYRLELQPAER